MMAAMLTAAELTAMRATQAEALPDSGTITRATLSSDGAGGQSESWGTGSTVSCRLGRLGQSGEERAIAERLTGVTPFVVTVPTGTDIRPEDRITIAGRTFEVAAVLATGAWETALRVAVTEVE